METTPSSGTIQQAVTGANDEREEGIIVPTNNVPAYAAYERKINLALSVAFAELIVQASQDKDARKAYRLTGDRRIWVPSESVAEYFQQYHLRYPGEVLERFEERIGADIQNVRALALALGDTRLIQTDNMFVGNQRSDFIRKVKRLSDGDVYLQGALYRLETNVDQQRSILAKLAGAEYVQTEDALFVLSLFENEQEGYQVMHSQLIRLFGAERTFSLVDNFGIIEWLFHFYGSQIKAYRGSQDKVLRTLAKLPTMFIKPGSREFETLCTAGYKKEEIAAANSFAVWSKRNKSRIPSYGVIAEKIAVSCCQAVLNSRDAIPDHLYDYVGGLLKTYEKFDIKYDGFCGIWQALQPDLSPTTPSTILWMNQNLQMPFSYRFDVFDPQYDVLADTLDRSVYCDLFTDQMLNSREPISLKQWLRRYQALTGKDYMEYFNWRRRYDARAFALLVEKKEIDLWEFFERHRTDAPETRPLSLLQEYALTVSSIQCYRFVEKLLRQYSFPQLRNIFGKRFYFHRCFIEGKHFSRHKENLYFSRPFLNAEQNRRLMEWIDTSVFQTEPEYYNTFVWFALESRGVQRMYGRSALAAILREAIKGNNYRGSNVEFLKQKLYSKAEYEAEQKAAAVEREQERLRQHQEEILKKTCRLQELYDGTAESLLTFCNGYFRDSEIREVLGMIFGKLQEWPAGRAVSCTSRELQCLFTLYSGLFRFEVKPQGEILNLVKDMIGGIAA